MKAPADGWDREEREGIDEIRDELEVLRSRHQHDPDVNLLRAGHHDALPPDLQSGVERRLAHDPWSRALVEGLDAAEPAQLDGAAQDRLLARIRREARRGAATTAHRSWLKPALASAALVAVAAAAWIASRGPSATPQVPPPAPERTIATTATPPALTLPLDQPEVTLSLAALTWRGAGGADNAYLRDLKPALDAFREGDHARADRNFAALESQYPAAVEVFFYGGVSRLFTGDAPRALAALTRAGELADAAFAPRVAWYRAIAEGRAGNLPQARAQLEALCRGNRERAAQACELVKQIDAVAPTPKTR